MNRPLSCYVKDIKNFILYDIPYGIQNLITWFPVIWTDRNWDYWFIYKILHKKLDLMEKHIRKHDNHTCAQADADNIKKCVLLLDRLIADKYHESAFKNHERKWGESDMIFTKSKEDPEMKKLDIIYPNVTSTEDEKLEKKDFKRAMNHEEYLKEQDINMLFNLMKKHIRTWWD